MCGLRRNLEPHACLADFGPTTRSIIDQHAAFGIAHKDDVPVIKRHPDGRFEFGSFAHDRCAVYEIFSFLDEIFSLKMDFDDMRNRLPVSGINWCGEGK